MLPLLMTTLSFFIRFLLLSRSCHLSRKRMRTMTGTDFTRDGAGSLAHFIRVVLFLLRWSSLHLHLPLFFPSVAMLALLSMSSSSEETLQWMLRVCVAMTFLGHGYLATQVRDSARSADPLHHYAAHSNFHFSFLTSLSLFLILLFRLRMRGSLIWPLPASATSASESRS